MKPNIDYSIYLITDRELMSTRTIEEAVEQAIKGGCTVVQLREKNTTTKEFYNTAIKIREITTKHKIPLIINDRIDIAQAIDADGVHIGQSDLPTSIVRKIIGEQKIIGTSVSNTREAIQAANDGADYIGVGAMFSTSTKTDANITTIEELKNIRTSVKIPIVIIGGINKKTIPLFTGIDIQGIALISAIISQSNIEKSTQEIKTLYNKTKEL